MHRRGKAGQGLTCDATNVEEGRQVPCLLGTKVSCGNRTVSDLRAQSKHPEWHSQKNPGTDPDHGLLFRREW